MLFKTLSAAVYGIDANIIEVEVDVSGIKTTEDHFQPLRGGQGEDLFQRADGAPADPDVLRELSTDCERLLERAMAQQGLSARAHYRILKVARTVADLEAMAHIEPKHIAEAIQYRTLDRTSWA